MNEKADDSVFFFAGTSASTLDIQYLEGLR